MEEKKPLSKKEQKKQEMEDLDAILNEMGVEPTAGAHTVLLIAGNATIARRCANDHALHMTDKAEPAPAAEEPKEAEEAQVHALYSSSLLALADALCWMLTCVGCTYCAPAGKADCVH